MTQAPAEPQALAERVGARLRLPGFVPAWAVAALCAAAALAAYAPSLRYDLVWDDPVLRGYVLKLFERGGLRAVLAAEFKLEEVAGYYRPLVLVSFLLDERLSNLLGTSHHATNLVLHAATAAAVARLILTWSASAAAALCGGLLFALHPVHVESVAFVSGRTDLWAALLAVLAALAWERARTRGGTAARLAFAAHLASFAAACLAKEVALLLPLALLWTDLMLYRGGAAGLSGFVLRNRAWLVGWAGVLAAVFLLRAGVAHVQLGAGLDPPVTGAEAGAAARLLLGRWLRYFGLLAVPWPLSAWYGVDQLQPTPAAVGGIAMLTGLGACAWRLGAARAFLHGMGWVAIFLVPVSGIARLPGSALAERFLYLPSVGLCLAAGALTAAAARVTPARRGLAAAWVGILSLCLTATLARLPVWRNDLSLALDMEATSPRASMGFARHALVAAQTGRYPEAAAAVREALKRDPTSVQHWMLSALISGRMGQIDAEIATYRRILAMAPGNAKVAYNLAMALLDQGKPQEAAAQLRATLAAHPDLEEASISLGRILEQQGERAEAAAVYRRLLARVPGHAVAAGRLKALAASP